jgi:FtsP/CotA-like multicopper oxidase with cupredoxin domain
MDGYVWTIKDVAWNEDVPPLHGHTFQVVEIDGKRHPGARRDTVLVTPGTRVVVAFDADNPGWWALHCHLLYHLDAGMFTTLRYV